MNEIDRFLMKYLFLDSRRIVANLPVNRFQAGHYRVRCLIVIMGLQVISDDRNSSKKPAQHTVFAYFL
jgi:hypothetical protein|tara:strand:- start:599 stop:802 length:204 start_codon:yes stop_codon:yes gene_type:complete